MLFDLVESDIQTTVHQLNLDFMIDWMRRILLLLSIKTAIVCNGFNFLAALVHRLLMWPTQFLF